MQIRLFNESDYGTVSGWWEKQNWPQIPMSSLSTIGFIISNGNGDTLAGWIYETNSDIALLEFIVGNPENKEGRDEAFKLLVDTASEYCTKRNFKNILTMVNHPKLIDRLETENFKKTDSNMSHFIRSL